MADTGTSRARQSLETDRLKIVVADAPKIYSSNDVDRLAAVARIERDSGRVMRSTTFWTASLLASGLAATSFAQDAAVSDLCAAASVESAQADQSGAHAARVIACAESGQSVSTTTGIGDQTHTVGDVGGEPLIAVSSDFGNVTYTTGQVGDRAVSASTVDVGESTLTVGTVGGQSINKVTTQVGDTSITTGQIGTDSINATTTQVGNTSFTSGVVDGQPIAVTTIEIGNVTYTTGQVGGQPVSSSTIKIGDVTYTTGQSGQ